MTMSYDEFKEIYNKASADTGIPVEEKTIEKDYDGYLTMVEFTDSENGGSLSFEVTEDKELTWYFKSDNKPPQP